MPSLAQQQIHHLNPLAARELRDHHLRLLGPEPLNNHLWGLGASGTGKTSMTESAILWPLFYFGRACITMDPVGTLSRRMVWRMCHYPRYLQPYLFNRLVYVARGAKDFVMPTPLYAPQDENESHYTTANRLIQVIARTDPFLVTASVEGMNAIKEAGTYGGQLAAALKLQVTEVADMLCYPEKWLSRLAQVTREDPLLRPAFAYFNQLKDANPSIRSRKTGSFLNHVLSFLSDPIMRAPYAASGPGLDLDAHVKRGDMILYDYSYLPNRESRQFAMLWDFLDIAEWAKRRGIAGRTQPCLWCIDEVSALTNLQVMEHSILGEDINELVTQYARNVGLQLCFMNQAPGQLPPAIVTALSQFGTKLVGHLPLFDDALYMAKMLSTYDPHKVRKRETVWANDPIPEYHATSPSSMAIFARAHYVPLDERTTEYTIDEQYQLAAQAIQQLPTFHFLVKAAHGEGDLTGGVRKVSFERLINGHFPDHAALEAPLAQLRKKWGVPIGELLKEIDERRPAAQPKASSLGKNRRRTGKRKKPSHAILSPSGGPAHERNDRDLPQPIPPKAPGDFWFQEE